MEAGIKLDLDRVIGTVDRRVFGSFVEHVGRCIYGGVYDEASPLSDERGFRRDVLEAAKALRIPLLRWPGGNFVSGYHWTDGIGPVDSRPRLLDRAWGAEDSNHFGTDEFIEYCRALGSEPYICVNMGTGTLDEAQAWVEYCNGGGNTKWANLRRQHGHREPYGVKYWGLGNEMYGPWQIGALSAEDYVKKAVEFAKAMKRTDPSIQLVGCGYYGWNDWDQIVLAGLGPYVDYHSIHIYTGSPDFHSNVFAPHQAERALDICQGLIEKTRYEFKIKHPIYVAYDEWNVWYRARGIETGIEERYTLADALAVATYLNIFVRRCNVVRMANQAQLVNVLGLIFTNREGLFLQTIYHPFKIYAEHVQEIALDAYVECPTHTLAPEAEATRWPHQIADLSPFKLLDVAATRDESGRNIALTVVNRDPSRSIGTTIKLADGRAVQAGTSYEVSGADPSVASSFEQPTGVSVQERPLELGGDRFDYTFPPHSVTLVKLHLAG